jgi:iron complex outermembrane receptor protein
MIAFRSVRHALGSARACLLVFARVARLSIVAAHAVASAQPAPAPDARLPPVTVSATRFVERAEALPFGVSVLTADEIRSSGVGTVNEAVMKLLGVPGRLDFFGGGDYALDLRGFGATADSNQVIVVDGIRLSEADLGGTRLAGIPIDAVERIEIIRGSGAVLYGEGATGGVIVITTKAGRGAARRDQADLYAATGSHGLRDARGTGTWAVGDVSLDASLNHRESDNHRANFHSRTDGASLAGQWGRAGLRAGARYAWDTLDTGLPGALTAAQYAADPLQTSTPADRGAIRNHRAGVFAEAVLGDWQVGVDAGWRDKALRSQNSGFAFDYDVDASSQALRARHSARLGGLDNTFVAGLDHDRWKRTVQGAFGTVAQQHSSALYLKDEVTLGNDTRLSAGWRTQHVEKDNSGAAAGIDQRPRAWELGVVQPVIAGVSLYGRYGSSFRLASVDEFSFTAPGATLQTQTSRDAEIGARWTHAGGRIELRAYRSALTHEIGFDPSAAGPFGFGANVNFDPTRRQGLELEATQSIGATANLRVNAATRRARFAGGAHDGKEVPLTPRRTLSLHADVAPAPGHRVDAGVNHVGSQRPDFDNACSMPSYTTADLRYAYQWGRAELALGIANLTGAKYYTLAFACVDGAVSSIYPEAGRAVTASVRLRF